MIGCSLVQHKWLSLHDLPILVMLHNVAYIVELIDLTLPKKKIVSSCLKYKIVYVLEISKGKQGCGNLNLLCCRFWQNDRYGEVNPCCFHRNTFGL